MVPTTDGDRQLALVKAFPTHVDFIDPKNPQAGLIPWEGNWRKLNKIYVPHIHTENFTDFLNNDYYTVLVLHTLLITILGWIGVVPASIAVAYGFSRFRIPGIEWLFILLIATILIPESVTLVPTYRANISLLNWLASSLPLESVSWLRNLNLGDSTLYRILPVIGPHFFGNAIFIFLLRQNFKSISRDLDEAAMLDGAGPLRILVSIILPQAIPVVTTISLIHFFYSWNEIRLASLYLGMSPMWTPVSFVNFGEVPILITMVIPVLVLFLGQRFFLKNVVVTGTEK
jgi:multiple sugar transport system permease protein